ncbi:dimethylsulfonioproprionate lyase family protein [Marivita sp. S0852]|uniref:dimethylsulfonioproprionate lyase family protein n=1 Tax=Marivita sp. S0852 TaxID=3373893 RepID=UPI00398231C4
METRHAPLQAFLDALGDAYFARTRDAAAIVSLHKIFADLESVEHPALATGRRLPICGVLDDLKPSSQAKDEHDLQHVMTRFLALEPTLVWQRRQGDWTGASENFGENHANTIIVGPGGLEQRTDVWLGVSLLAPHVLYPDHRHTPEETYLVMTQGGFRQGRNPWVDVTRGETFYNPHNILHSMRSGDHPLLVFWALREKSEADALV